MELLKKHADLKENLSALAHLIHGSSEGRFSITYCTAKEGLKKEEVEGVGYKYMAYEEVVSLFRRRRRGLTPLIYLDDLATSGRAIALSFIIDISSCCCCCCCSSSSSSSRAF